MIAIRLPQGNVSVHSCCHEQSLLKRQVSGTRTWLARQLLHDAVRSDAGILFTGEPRLRAPRLLRGLASSHKAVDVAAAGTHTLVATEQGGVWGFGSNNWHQLADGQQRSHDRPVQVSAPL